MNTAGGVSYADPRTQERIAELYRQLRNRVEAARPLYTQHEQGTLRAPTPEQRRTIAEFPAMLEDLEELRLGRMPAPRRPGGKGDAGSGAAAGEAAVPGMTAVVSKSSKRRGKKAPVAVAAAVPATTTSANGNGHGNGHGHGNGNGKATNGGSRPQGRAGAKEAESEEPEEEEDGDDDDDDDDEEDVGAGIATEEDLLATLQSIQSRPVQEELVCAYVERYMRHSSEATQELALAEKKLSGAEGLKKKIISGAVKKPSSAQLSVIEQLASLRKQVAAARRKVKKEEEQLRERLMAQLPPESEEEQEEEEVEEEEDEVEEEEVKGMKGEGGSGSHEEPVAVSAGESSHGATSPAAAEGVAEADVQRDVEKSPDPKLAGDDAATDSAEAASEEQQSHADDAAAASEDRRSESAPAEPEEPEVVEEEEEPAREPTPPPPPPPPAHVTLTPGSDWGRLRYVAGNAAAYTLEAFQQLAGPVCREAVEAAAQREEHAGRAADGSDARETAADDAAVPDRCIDRSCHYVRQHIPVGAAAAPLLPPPPQAPKQAEEPTGAGAVDAVLARLNGEWAMLQEHPVPRVVPHRGEEARSAPAGGGRRWVGARAPGAEGAAHWHADVHPTSGPLAGQPVHVSITFPPAYPFVPPTVRCPVSLPHKGLVTSSSGEANTLYLTYSSPSSRGKGRSAVTAAAAIASGGWLPDMGVREVLRELQRFFDAEGFTDALAALGPERAAAEMQRARVALALHRSNCDGCTAASAGAFGCINGPFLVPAGAEREREREDGGDDDCSSSGGSDGAEEEVTSSKEEVEGSGAQQQQPPAVGPRRRPRRRGRQSRVVYADTVASAGGVINGPFVGCWGHVLFTRGAAAAPPTAPEQQQQHAAAEEAEGFVCLSLSYSGAAGTPAPIVEVYAAPETLLTNAGSGGGGGFAAAVGPLLSSSGDAVSSPEAVWRLTPDAFRPVSGAAGGADGQLQQHRCTLCFAADTANVSRVQRAAAAAAGAGGGDEGEMIVVAVPPADEAVAAFVVVLRVPDSSTAARAAFFCARLDGSDGSDGFPYAAAVAEGDGDSAGEVGAAAVLQGLWPGARSLLDAAAPPPPTQHGMLVGVPFGFPGVTAKALRDAVGGLTDDPLLEAHLREGYYTPRTALLHLRGGRTPAVVSAAAFAHYRGLVAALRRAGRRERPTDAAAPFLATASEAVVRRYVLDVHGDGGPSSVSAVSALSDYFFGLRVLFIPLAPCSAGDLAAFTASCAQLYRSLAASTAYTAPFRPHHAIHILALVLHRAMGVGAGEGEGDDGDVERAAARGVVRAVIALGRQLADADSAFRAACAAAVADGAGALRLFLRSPFVPLPTATASPFAAAEEGEGKEPGAAAPEAHALGHLRFAMGDVSAATALTYMREVEAAALLFCAYSAGQQQQPLPADATPAPATARKWAEVCELALHE